MTALACDQLQQQLNNQPDIDLVADFGDDGHDENILVLCTPEHLLIQFDKFHLSRQQSEPQTQEQAFADNCIVLAEDSERTVDEPLRRHRKQDELNNEAFRAIQNIPSIVVDPPEEEVRDPILHCDEHMSDVDPDEQDRPATPITQPVTQPPAPRKLCIKRGPRPHPKFDDQFESAADRNRYMHRLWYLSSKIKKLKPTEITKPNGVKVKAFCNDAKKLADFLDGFRKN